MVNVYIKGVDAEAYKLAKMLAIHKDETVGNIISEALVSFMKEDKSGLNPVVLTLGVFGTDEKALARERKAVRKIRKQIGKDFEARLRRHERLGYFPAD